MLANGGKDEIRKIGDTVVTRSGEQSSLELTEWNCKGIMECIEQWYSGKNDWANQTSGDEFYTYKCLIDPSYRSLGIGEFRCSGAGWYSGVALELGDKDSMNTKKNTSAGDCVQTIEVRGKDITNLAFSGTPPTHLQEGDTGQLPVDVKGTFVDGSMGKYGMPYSGLYQAVVGHCSERRTGLLAAVRK